MSDPAIASHPPVVPMLQEWSKYVVRNDEEADARRAYVERELERLAREGISPLYAAVTLPLADQQTVAFAALRNLGARFMLRLADGCSPPACDAQGRELPPDEVGKVLVAKVGSRSFRGPGERSMAAQRGADIYIQRRITSTPALFELEEAITIMRQWGYRVRPKKSNKPGQPPRRDEWLVVQVREDGMPFAPVEPQLELAPNPRRRGG